MTNTDFQNPGDDAVKALLQRVRNVAVLGLSANENRPSHGVAKSLQQFGYSVIPVNPGYERILGEQAYANPADVPVAIDLLNVFRAPEHVPAIVQECIELGLPALWLQEGVVHDQAAERAREAGIQVVMDRCIYKEYRRLIAA